MSDFDRRYAEESGALEQLFPPEEVMQAISSDDVVYHMDDEETLGVVLAVGWDEDEVDEEEEYLEPSDVRVSWFADGEEFSADVPAEELVVQHRALAPGSIVYLGSRGPHGQSGIVKSMESTADVILPNKRRLVGVPLSKLEPCYALRDHPVFSKDLKSAGIVDFEGPAVKLEFGKGEMWWLQMVDDSSGIEVIKENDYCPPLLPTILGLFPGARVQLDPEAMEALIPDELYRPTTGHLEEYRLSSAIKRKRRKLPDVATVVSLHDCLVGVGWRCGPNVERYSTLTSQTSASSLLVMNLSYMVGLGEPFQVRKEAEKEVLSTHLVVEDRKNTQANKKRTARLKGLPIAGVASVIKSACQVVWQDGTTGEYDTTQLIASPESQDNDFWPFSFVSNAYEPGTETSYGVVVDVNSQQQTCRVRWVETEAEDGNMFVTEPVELSVFDVIDHPLLAGVALGSVCTHVGTFRTGRVKDIAEDGMVVLSFVDGSTVRCKPLELMYVDMDIEEEEEEEEDGEDLDDFYSEDEEEYGGDSAVREVADQTVMDESLQWWSAMLVESSGEADAVVLPSVEEVIQEVEGVTEDASAALEASSFAVSSSAPPGFDPIEVDPKAVMRDWRLLRRSLPDGVHVRVFEDRMDLLQFVIFGSSDTPYADVPVVFTAQFPANYPNSPPKVTFHSEMSWRMNPNLYECGKVCLSLLGTWEGDVTESWSAAASMLQVIVSLQGLVLGQAEPYYLEAGFEKQRGTVHGSRESFVYNQKAVLSALQHYNRIFAKVRSAVPCDTFEPSLKEVIAQHTAASLPRVKERVKKYLQQYKEVASCDLPADASSFGVPLRHSKGFYMMIERVFPNLGGTGKPSS